MTLSEFSAKKGDGTFKEFFIGIDSDGTGFDSMNIKHNEAFLPAMFTVWTFGGKEAEFAALWRKMNLYSRQRGINRFPGLAEAFATLPPEGKDPAPLFEFVKNAGVYSNASLKEWMDAHPSAFLDEVYAWSLEADKLFARHTQSIRPFNNVEPTLKVMNEKADIIVISSASSKGLVKDWAPLQPLLSAIGGQEDGPKKQQIALGIEAGGYAKDNCLVIGDAPGDQEAAEANGVLFYPIIPGEEEASWRTLREEGLPRFFSGTYKGPCENALVRVFLETLGLSLTDGSGAESLRSFQPRRPFRRQSHSGCGAA